MNKPVALDIPHKLGKAGARARVEKGFGRIADAIPGGSVTAHQWNGDTLNFTVEGMGQRIGCRLDIHEASVHAVVDLPPFLALFAEKIRGKLAKTAPKLLE